MSWLWLPRLLPLRLPLDTATGCVLLICKRRLLRYAASAVDYAALEGRQCALAMLVEDATACCLGMGRSSAALAKAWCMQDASLIYSRNKRHQSDLLGPFLSR